jgi:hypothetical protein
MLGHPLLVSPNKLKLRVGGLGSDSERRRRALPLLVPCHWLPETPNLSGMIECYQKLTVHIAHHR